MFEMGWNEVNRRYQREQFGRAMIMIGIALIAGLALVMLATEWWPYGI